MAAIISENYLSRSFTVGQQSVRELIFDVQDTDDEEEVRTAIIAHAPAVYLGQVIDSVNADPLGGGVWKGYARYLRFEDDTEYTFDTGGGTQRITQSLATVSTYAPGGSTAPNFQGAIGVSEDRVEGTDITAPAFNWTETHQIDNVLVDGAYKLNLFALTGRTNDATFKGLAIGEALFMGATGTKRGTGKWAITFRFAGSPNVSGMTIGDITGVDKAGWDYLWVRYADFEDGTAKSLVKRPIAAYVERVYLSGDMSLLGIGTT